MYTNYFGFRETPFSVTPDPRFFYTNPQYLEAFAALRYGIKAKKGFILITGEVGTGKTTLLRKLMRNLEPTNHCVFIFNTQLSFPEMLKVILHDLGVAKRKNSSLTMVEQLNAYLIKQLNKGHTVSLLIDEAQHLSDEALEGLRLLSNVETDKEKLLQIVLMGQPELEIKLNQPELRQLKQRVAFHCRLVPLKEEEVGAYIDLRLRAVGYEGNGLFHPDVIRWIALYSKGIPRLINIICDNTLLTAYATSQRTVSAKMVQEAALDLGLKKGKQAVKTTATGRQETVSVVDNDQAALDELWEGAMERLGKSRLRRRSRPLFRIGVATLLVLLLGGGGAAIYSRLGDGGAAIYSRQAWNYLSDLASGVENFLGARVASTQAPKEAQTSPKEPLSPSGDPRTAQEEFQPRGDLMESGETDSRDEPVITSSSGAPSELSHTQAGTSQETPFLKEHENHDVPSPRSSAKTGAAQTAMLQGKSRIARSTGQSPDEIRSISKNWTRIYAADDSEGQRKRIQVEIRKAIFNRAVSGVEVSFREGTAYLEGKVATENQKLAAEQAAQNVPGVREVRSSISVSLDPAPAVSEH